MTGRVLDALDPVRLSRETGLSIPAVEAAIQELLDAGLLKVEADSVHRPETGTNPAEDIAQDFLRLEREAKAKVQKGGV